MNRIRIALVPFLLAAVAAVAVASPSSAAPRAKTDIVCTSCASKLARGPSRGGFGVEQPL